MRASLLVIFAVILIASAVEAGPVKTITGIDLSGLGNIPAEENNIKKIEGVNFMGLGEALQEDENEIKTIVGVNFAGLGNISQPGQGGDEQEENWQDGQDEWESPLPELVNVSETTTIVYIGETSIPLASYQTTFGKFLWIENYRGLSEYTSIPQYSGLSLIAYTSTGGQGEFLEMYPSDSLNQGLYQRTYINLNPGYNRIPYRGDVSGRHYLLFTMNNQPSNSIIIDVIGNEVETSQPVLGTTPGGSMA